jgi:hypothetical protein
MRDILRIPIHKFSGLNKLAYTPEMMCCHITWEIPLVIIAPSPKASSLLTLFSGATGGCERMQFPNSTLDRVYGAIKHRNFKRNHI